MAAMKMWIILLPLVLSSICYGENENSPHVDEEDQPTNDERLYRAAGEPCNANDFEWYPVDDEPTKFLHCDRSTMTLLEGRCNIVQGAERIFDERIERCIIASSRKRRSAGILKSAGLHEPCLQYTDCLDNMYCPAGTCECLSGYFARNQECVAAVAPGQTGCDDDTVCQYYWPMTRCNQGICECTVPENEYGESTMTYTASPQQTAEGIVCVILQRVVTFVSDFPDDTSGSEYSFCPLPIPTASSSASEAGGPAVITAPGLVCTVVNGIGEIGLNGKVTTLWSDMVISVPTSASSALCCPNRAHTCMQPKPSSSQSANSWELTGETRYWYNQATGGCETFQWDGNTPWANNFKTEQHCLSYCGGICRRGYTQVTNGKSHTCDAQCTGDKECRDASNNGKLCCQTRTTICGADGGKTPVEGNDAAGVGPTSHSVAKWKYDQGRCVPFRYTGWGGNFNNFATKKECDRFCVTSACEHGQPLRDANGDPQPCGQGCPSSYECSNGFCCPKRQAVCTQPQLAGSCGQSITVYSYNAASKNCKQLLYSGCGGNDNNFESYDDCVEHCRGIKPEPRCSHGIADKDASGNYYTCTAGAAGTGCRENYECRFDASTQTTGCCPRKEYTCGIALDEGTVCGITTKRWYSNASSESCEKFTYNGCDGNSNNFATLRTCEKYCWSAGECPFGGEPYNVNGVTAVCSAQDDCPSGYACDTSVKYCCQTRETICQQPQSEGTSCGAESQRYSYYSDYRKCDSFTYYGCDGNENNFETLIQCNHVCGSVGCLAGEVALWNTDTDSSQTCYSDDESSGDDCPAGYACRQNSITDEHICCGSTDG